jgi:outer membrane protein insertion porin family
LTNVAAVRAKTLESIRIEGLLVTGPEIVTNALEVREGRDFTPADVQESIRKLYRLGLFRKIDFLIDAETDTSVALTLSLEEFPILDKIEFEGNRKIKRKALNEKKVLDLHRPFTDAQLHKSKETIYEMYVEKGYLLAEIDAQVFKTSVPGNAIVKYVIKEGPRVRVRSIVFRGNQEVKTRWLARRFKTKENRWWRSGDFNYELYRAHLDTLVMHYQDRGLLDAAIERDSVWYSEDKRDIFIDITVSEGRKYFAGDVAFTGNRVVETDTLLSKVALTRGKPFRKSQYEMTKYMIENTYREEGYLWVRVDDRRVYRGAQLASEPAPTAQTSVPAVTEPPRGPVKAAVYVTGIPPMVAKPFNSAISSALMKSKIYAGIEPIDVSGPPSVPALADAGRDAGVSYIFAINVAGQISVSIIDVAGAAELAKTSLDGTITAVNAASVAKKIVDFILNAGPKPASVAQERYDGPDTIDLVFEIVEGRPAIVRKINVRGNSKTMEKVIRREITIMPGQRYRQSLMMSSQQNIMRLNYFTAVVPDISPNEDGTVDLVFDITERDNIGQLTLGAAYSDQDKFTGTFSTAIPNLRGAGQELKLELQLGGFRQLGMISFTEPWAWDTPWWMTGTVFYDRQIYSYYSSADDYDTTQSYGFRVGVGRSRLSWPDNKFRIQSVYQLSREETNRPDMEIGKLNILETGWMSKLRFNIERYDLDMPMFPNDGSRLTVTPEVAGLGGDFRYLKGTVSYENYFRLPLKLVFGSQVTFGAITMLGDKIIISSNDLFTGGGAYGDAVIRGYSDWAFGGYRHGNRGDGISMFAANLSLRYPVIDQQVYVGMFTDMGNTWPAISGIDLGDLYRGIGGGIRINLPMIGLMGVDVGYGLDPIEKKIFDSKPAGFNWHIIMNKGF